MDVNTTENGRRKTEKSEQCVFRAESPHSPTFLYWGRKALRPTQEKGVFAVSKSFEDIPVWQDGRALVRDIYSLTRNPSLCRDFGFCDQIRRASVSICSNIAEGHERGTTSDLIQFLFYAKGSAGEVRSQLYHVEDLNYTTPEDCQVLRDKARSISKQLSSWIRSMQGPDFAKGPKHNKRPGSKD